MEAELLKMYEGPNERCGFVLSDGTVVECTNVSEKPDSSFAVSTEDMAKFLDDAVATWHTHPYSSANLSGDDYTCFYTMFDLDHYIVGNDGVKKYVVRRGRIFNET